MKKIAPLLIIILLSNLINAQVTVIPDANFEQALIDLGYDSGSTDGTVNTANINTIDSLDILSRGISNLAGIEDFSNLVYLNVSGNLLTNLNISQNTALITLLCYDNQFTNLDVTQNTALAELFCHNNFLTNLDVTNNPNLTTLWCAGNQITSLDVTNNSNLIDFRCNSNQIINLDVTNIPNLTVFYCNSNQITSLDVTNNPNLTDILCSNNQLTNLDVTNNPNLTTLWCNSNQITSLDVTQNTVLTSLLVYNNQLTALDISQNTALTEFDCLNNDLTALDVTQNVALTELICAGNPIGVLDASKNVALTYLNCNVCDLICLNVKNGNNANMFYFFADVNPNLTCIEVDDVAFSTMYWNVIDAASSFSTNCNNTCTVAVNETESVADISIFPNPNSGVIFIELEEIKRNIKATLTNSLGQIILTQESESTDFMYIDIDMPKGIYFIQLETEGAIKTFKVLKE